MLNTPPGYDPAGYAERFGTGFPSNLPMPFVRASLGARFVAYLLDILFILGFTALLTLAITVLGVLTSGSAGPCSRSFPPAASSTAR